MKAFPLTMRWLALTTILVVKTTSFMETNMLGSRRFFSFGICGLTEFLAKKGLYASETELGNDMSQESWKEKGFSAEDWPCETAILLDVAHVPTARALLLAFSPDGLRMRSRL